MEGLIDIYSNAGLFCVNQDGKSLPGSLGLSENAPLLFESTRFKGSPGKQEGESVIVDASKFQTLFESTTVGVLQKVENWDKCIVAGGQVLGCLRGLADEVEKPSDVDIFIYGIHSPEEGKEKVHTLLTQIHEGYRIANRCDPEERPYVFIDVVRTDHTLTLIPKYPGRDEYGEEVELPKVQIVTRKFSTAADVLAVFDIDCCCVAFDGAKVWANQRSLRALCTGVNLVDLNYRSATFENRLLKYSRRGYAVQDPAMRREAPACLDAYFGGQKGVVEKVDLENLVRCIRRSSGLLKLLLADLAGKRGIIWAGMIVDVGSFEATNPDEVFTNEYGPSAVDSEKGPVVFHPPLVKGSWMAKYKSSTLEELLGKWEEYSAEMNIAFVPKGPEINRSRADWERGVYESSRENIEALLKLQHAQPSKSSDQPTSSTAQTGTSKSSRASQASALLLLPNLLLLEVLNRCDARGLAAAALTCKTLERAILFGGLWKRLCLQAFGPPTPFDTKVYVPPEQWARAYRNLNSLSKMGWREWDVNPMRAQAAWRETSEANAAEYERNVPLPRSWHATAVVGNKLVLTGGFKEEVSTEGTFMFDLHTRHWSRVATMLQRPKLLRRQEGPDFETLPWEFQGRSQHSMTAVKDHEILVLFGRTTLTNQELRRVQRAGQARVEAALHNAQHPANWVDVNERPVGEAHEREAILGEKPHRGFCADAYLLDVNTWTYEKLKPVGIPPLPRMGHSACLHPDKKSVLVFGGRIASEGDGHAFTDDLHMLAQEWRDGKRVWVWRELETEGEKPEAQDCHGACITANKMVVLGGDACRSDERMKVWVLDLKSMRWSHPRPTRKVPRTNEEYPGNPIAAVGDKVVLAVGGRFINYFNLSTLQWEEQNRCSDHKLTTNEGHTTYRGKAPAKRYGNTAERVGYSIYVVGGQMGRHRNVFELMPVLDLLGYESAGLQSA